MTKMKATLVVLAAIAATAGAMASKKMQAPCEGQQQYTYVSGMGYQPVAEGYYCLNGSSANCTYWLSNTAPVTYTVCTIGLYGTAVK